MNKILFIQTAFLGDVILATAAIAEAKRIFPNASIDVLVKKGNESLLQNNPSIHNIYIFNKSNKKLSEIFRLTKIFKTNRYDIIFNFHRFGSSGIITLLSGATKKYGFKKNPFSWCYTKKFEHNIGNGQHEVERNLQLLQEFGAATTAQPELYPSQENYEKVKSYKNQTYYCIAPASVWFTKQLPEHKWIELIQILGNEHCIYLLGAPNDVELCERLQINSKQNNIINLAGKLSLLESAVLMKDAKRNYVNDSGPLHIASAMNAPVTAFFCSTITDFGFGPLSNDKQVLEVKNLECRPCGLHGYKACPLGHFKCGEINLLSVKK
ncbi:MAG: glycosyltransferase family 9 protein [Chitinophagales bacterium]|nr:glycosyltransferase family 9 protein [Chitinophagaceae bacterium]MCZ2299129.1 glycosyltransferase family 9 protein [Chitinophagales bacterium]